MVLFLIGKFNLLHQQLGGSLAGNLIIETAQSSKGAENLCSVSNGHSRMLCRRLRPGEVENIRILLGNQSSFLGMSKLAEPLKIYPQVLENVRVTDKKAAQDDEAVQAAVKAVAEALGDTGRILVRESGTEPVVRVMVEAPDHDTCQKYVSQVVETIKSRGYGV